MAKKRTTAQRRAAAKAAWVVRRQLEAQSAKMPTPGKTPLPPVDFGPGDAGSKSSASAAVAIATPPTTAVATREGDDLFITISGNGSLFRHRVSYDTMRKLGLDALQLVG